MVTSASTFSLLSPVSVSKDQFPLFLFPCVPFISGRYFGPWSTFKLANFEMGQYGERSDIETMFVNQSLSRTNSHQSCTTSCQLEFNSGKFLRYIFIKKSIKQIHHGCKCWASMREWARVTALCDCPPHPMTKVTSSWRGKISGNVFVFCLFVFRLFWHVVKKNF